MFSKNASKKIVEYQNELISKHCDEVENIYRQMRGWRHDFHNHIQAMLTIIEKNDNNISLKDYLLKLNDDLISVDTVIRTGNVMVDAILNSKLSLAKSKNIEITAKAIVPKDIEISDVDLCVLLGNLLDNAIEACQKNCNSKKFEFNAPFIRVYISAQENQLYLCVTNSVYIETKKVDGKFLSTKKSATHGFGLLRIDKICNKYNGYCSRNIEPGVFSTEILLPLHQ
ncbi:MAG: ATP-binding protein [Oscillospiraceae bacterium]